MKPQPKPWLWLLLLPLSLILWFVCISPAPTISRENEAKIIHLLNRLSFGPRPGDIEYVSTIGIDKYIQEQLDPASVSEPRQLKQMLLGLPSLKATPIELLQEYRLQRRRAGQGSPLSEQEQRQMAKKRRKPSNSHFGKNRRFSSLIWIEN